MDNYRKIVAECCKHIAKKRLNIAFAESATAGKLAYEFSLTKYSGDILKGGLLCYDVCIKKDLLGVSKELIEKFTPESMEVTRAMCSQLQKKIKTDLSVAVTGLTTPGGSESPDKPVGTMFYSIILGSETVDKNIILSGSQEDIINQTISSICTTLIEML